MPTDYACQAAVEQAARAVTPVREHLLPREDPPPPPAADLPPALRDYLGPGYPGAPTPQREPRRPRAPRQAHGAAVLRLFLDGLRADLSHTLVDWVARLEEELTAALGVRGDAAAPPAPRAGAWEALTQVRERAQEVLTALVASHREGEERQSELYWRLVLVGDLCAGAFRRMTVPGEVAGAAAAELAGTAGGLFGVRVPGRVSSSD